MNLAAPRGVWPLSFEQAEREIACYGSRLYHCKLSIKNLAYNAYAVETVEQLINSTVAAEVGGRGVDRACLLMIMLSFEPILISTSHVPQRFRRQQDLVSVMMAVLAA
jgi:hypothetical protein